VSSGSSTTHNVDPATIELKWKPARADPAGRGGQPAYGLLDLGKPAALLHPDTALQRHPNHLP